jgi:hypothetical protein
MAPYQEPKPKEMRKLKKKLGGIFGMLKRNPKGIYMIKWISLSHPEIISDLNRTGVKDPPARITRYIIIMKT